MAQCLNNSPHLPVRSACEGQVSWGIRAAAGRGGARVRRLCAPFPWPRRVYQHTLHTLAKYQASRRSSGAGAAVNARLVSAASPLRSPCDTSTAQLPRGDLAHHLQRRLIEHDALKHLALHATLVRARTCRAHVPLRAPPASGRAATCLRRPKRPSNSTTRAPNAAGPWRCSSAGRSNAAKPRLRRAAGAITEP